MFNVVVARGAGACKAGAQINRSKGERTAPNKLVNVAAAVLPAIYMRRVGRSTRPVSLVHLDPLSAAHTTTSSYSLVRIRPDYETVRTMSRRTIRIEDYGEWRRRQPRRCCSVAVEQKRQHGLVSLIWRKYRIHVLNQFVGTKREPCATFYDTIRYEMLF